MFFCRSTLMQKSILFFFSHSVSDLVGIKGHCVRGYFVSQTSEEKRIWSQRKRRRLYPAGMSIIMKNLRYSLPRIPVSTIIFL